MLLSFFIATTAIASSPESNLGSNLESNLESNPEAKISIDVEEFTLENGMLFLVVNRPATPQVACRLAIRAGSALETTGQTGIAHMLEHMLFKGTKNFGTLDWEKDLQLQTDIEAAYKVIDIERHKRSPDQALIRRQLEKMTQLRNEVQQIYVPQAFSSQLGKNGAVGVNAFTTRDQTQYVMSIPSDMIEQWFSIASEQIFEPAWREFYVEKGVVQREWAYRYVNNPNGAAWLDLYATAYTAHPYQNPVIGWKSDMENFSTTAARKFHERNYHPANAVCVLVGDISVEKARQLAKTYFSRYPAGKRSPEAVTTQPSQQGPVERIRYLKGARTPLVRIGFHGAPMGTDEFFALDAMTMILSSGRSARMNREIVEKGLATQAWAHNPDNRYGGMIILGGSPIEPETASPDTPTDTPNEEQKQAAYLAACRNVEKLLIDQVENLKDKPVSSRDLARLKKLNRRDFIDRLRGNEDLAGTLATLEVQTGWRYLTAYLDRMERVTPEMIQAVAQKYFQNDNRTSVYVIPGGQPDRPPEPYSEVRSVSVKSASTMAPSTQLDNHSLYPTPEAWRHPLSFSRQPEKISYPPAETTDIKGARVFYLPDHQLPLIDLRLMIKAGSVDVPESKIGLATLLSATIIRGGTADYSPKELAQILDENAIRLSVNIGEESSEVHLSVLKNDWKKGMSLLKSVLTHPRFDIGVLKTTKIRATTALKRQGGDAQNVAGREWLIWHFKDHPYGRDPLIGLETIDAIAQTDLTGFLTRYFVPSNMVVAVSGDINKDQAIKDLTQLMDALPQGPAPQRDMASPTDTAPVLALIHKPGQVQSQIMLGMPGIRRDHPDFWKLRLLVDILGGSDSLLYKRLRDDLGLVYSAGFYQTYRWQAGLLLGYIGCKGNKTNQVIAETIQTINQLLEKVPESDFKLKKLDALNSFVFNVDSPSALVATYGRYAMRNEPLDTLERIQTQFIQATHEDMSRLAKTHLNTRQLQIIIVADKTIPITAPDGENIALETDLKRLAAQMDLPYRELALR